MISMGLEFESGGLDSVLKRFLCLPSCLRPTHFGDDETDKRRRTSIDASSAFSAFFENRTTSFFLFGQSLQYFVSTSGTSIKVYGSLQTNVDWAKLFLVHMAYAQPVFGYACADEERDRWNRVTVQQGSNAIESWVGRDIRKYIPGLYWLTLLPATLAQQHNVPLSLLKEVALEHAEIEPGVYFFRFYDRPEDWGIADHMAGVRASVPGIFNVETIKPLLPAAKTFLELEDILSQWT